jgi:chromosome partitioning protein
MPIISICSNKGGVGKTTSVQNIGVYLAKKGYKVALIDLDAQANLSIAQSNNKSFDLNTALENNKILVEEDFAKTNIENLFILPNEKNVGSDSFQADDQIQKFLILKKVIPTDVFDFILIDTPPALEMPTFNALVASDYVLIPIKHDRFSAEGLTTLLGNIESAKMINAKLEVIGIFGTFAELQTNLAKSMTDALQNLYPNLLLRSSIRKNIKFAEAQLEDKSIFEILDERGTKDYKNLCDEILIKIKYDQQK